MADTGNSKGPAPAQAPAWLNRAPADPAPTPEAPQLIPASDVKPQDIGTLSIEYRDGKPVILVSGGRFVPAHVAVATPDGETDIAFSAAPRRLSRPDVEHVYVISVAGSATIY